MLFPVSIWCDGACSGNPGPGAWAFIVKYSHNGKDYEKQGTGFSVATTNNRMELESILHAIESLKKPCDITLYTDSLNCIGWLSKGWKRNAVVVAQLCREIEKALKSGGHTINFQHVRGHNGDTMNELVNALAQGTVRSSGAPVTLIP